MTCDACATAEQRCGCWPEYRSRCFGCTCRAIARAHAAQQAFDHHRRDELEEVVGRLFNSHSRAAALAEIRRWWDIDHSTTGNP